MPRFNPFDAPGFAEAVWQERVARDAAFLGTTENVAGYELRPMTLPDYLILRLAGNALLREEPASPEELGAFLWLLSVDYHPRAGRRRRRFMRRCREFCEPAPPWLPTRGARARWLRRKRQALRRAAEVHLAAEEFVREACQDRPPSRRGSGFVPSYYSDAVYWCALLGREFGYSVEQVMRMPLKMVFGFVVEIQEHSGSKTPLTNPSDRFRAKWLAEKNRELLGN